MIISLDRLSSSAIQKVGKTVDYFFLIEDSSIIKISLLINSAAVRRFRSIFIIY